MSSCVYYDKSIKYKKFDSPVYSIIPTIITKIANGSRRDSSYRLLSRCVRHATNSKFYPGRLSDITVSDITIKRSRKITLEWSCEVPASMKAEKYLTTVRLSIEGEIIACDCKCKIGGI